VIPMAVTRSSASAMIPDDIEWLYWVGCAGALDDRAKRSTQAIARVFNAAGIKFAILGPQENCTGDPARRIGNEYLWQEIAKANIETLQGANVNPGMSFWLNDIESMNGGSVGDLTGRHWPGQASDYGN